MQVDATKASFLGRSINLGPDTLLRVTLRADELINRMPHAVTGWAVLQNHRYVLYDDPGLKGTLVTRQKVVAVDIDVDLLELSLGTVDLGQDRIESVRSLVGMTSTKVAVLKAGLGAALPECETW